MKTMAFLFLPLLLSTGCATTAPAVSRVSAEVAPATPAPARIVLDDIVPTHSLEVIIGVRLRFLDAPVELGLEQTGKHIWEMDLTAAQLAELAPSGHPTKHTGRITITSQTGEGSTGTEERDIELMVGPREAKSPR